MIILVYVDDLLITGNSHSMITEVKRTRHHNFKMKDLGELRYFLGIEALRSEGGIVLNQRKCAMELISKAGLSGCRLVATPMGLNHKLTIVDYDNHIGNTGDKLLEDAGSYQRLIGKLLCLTITRPNISFVVQVLS